jgi:hypothetical protein
MPGAACARARTAARCAVEFTVYRRVIAVYRMSFSEPWDWNDHDLQIEIDAAPASVEWPVHGRVVACNWDESFVGRKAELRRRHRGDEAPLGHFPVVSVAIEADDAESGLRGIGYGTLTLV